MPSPSVKDLIKDFVKDFGKVFAVRLTRPAKNRRTHPSSTTTHHEGDHSIPVDIPMHPGSLARDPGLELSIDISSARSSWGDPSARKASDMAQTFLPFVQAIAGPIPLAGAPIKATIGGLLEIFKVMDRRGQNKVDLDSLASRLDRLRHDLCNAPRAQDHLEQSRREILIGMLLDTSATLTELRKRSLAYPSVTQDIAGCFTEIDRYMAEYLVVLYSLKIWSSQMQSQHDIHEVLAILRRRQDSVGPTPTQLIAAVTLGCVTLVDATGHEHAISMNFCTSFQQLSEMLQVLFKRDSIEAQLQRQYMEQGQYDLCIDDDKQVTRLTSHEWPSIEAGTKIVMRVVIEQQTSSRVDYRCHFCGAVNDVSAGSIMDSLHRQASCSINCRVCKRRFQISRGSSSAKQSTQSSNIDTVPRTEAEMHLIRNFRVQQTDVRDLVFWPAYLTLMVLRSRPALSWKCVISSFGLPT
ncbi:hypothetical protein EV702DRAFT_1249073 [Suillus placidus]|uniref:Ubiquitin-like domain-containing protein n=1 Tax=Suillus placidus TaxID=48579 RepID=A0A9P7CXG0_9AGAM|nr:hypothetical protein EV702DRAFT_1249073 [Suillus placidus]